MLSPKLHVMLLLTAARKLPGTGIPAVCGSHPFHKKSKEACEITELSACPLVSIPNQLNDFHEFSYERPVTEDHPSVVRSNFL
jgi:hypothetical protein